MHSTYPPSFWIDAQVPGHLRAFTPSAPRSRTHVLLLLRSGRERTHLAQSVASHSGGESPLPPQNEFEELYSFIYEALTASQPWK